MDNQLPDESATKWMQKFAYNNYWRVQRWMDLEDLIQEGYFAYIQTRRKYPDVTNKAHIMSLFKLVFHSRLEDIVRKNTRRPVEVQDDPGRHNRSLELEYFDPSNFMTIMCNPPKHILKIIAVFNDPAVRKELYRPRVNWVKGRRDTLNARLCRLLRLDAEQNDVVAQLKSYLHA